MTRLHSAVLLYKYGHYWFQKTKMATPRNPNSRLQNDSPQTNGWRHGGYVHLYYIVYGYNQYTGG